MFIKYIAFVFSAVVFSLLSVFVLNYTKLKAEKTFNGKIMLLKSISQKRKIFLILMFILNLFFVIFYLMVYSNVSIIFFIKRIILISILWSAAFFDLQSYRIPNKLILLGLALRAIVFVFELIFSFDKIVQILLSSIIAAVGMFILSFVCNLIMKNSLGMGDVKLFMLMGLFQGINGIISSVFCSLVVSFYFYIPSGNQKKGRNDFIPFAPGILIGTFCSIILTGE